MSPRPGLLCAFAGFVAASSARADDTQPEPLSAQAFLSHFLRNDAELASQRAEVAVAKTRVEQSADRLRLKGELRAPLGYQLYSLPGGQSSDGYRATLGDAAVSMKDGWGGSLRAAVSGRLLSEPLLEQGGNMVGVDLAYGLPLLRNRGGILYETETSMLAERAKARGAEHDARLLARCRDGLALYLRAFLLQEQDGVWQDLLATKEKTYSRTERDYKRRMLTALDNFAARSDWLEARDRNREFKAQRDAALFRVASYLPEPSRTLALQNPEALLEVLPTDGAAAQAVHPALVVFDKELAAIEHELHLVERSHTLEVEIGPEVNATRYSDILVGTGASGPSYVPLTTVAVMLGVTAELPLIEPTPDYETAILRYRMQELKTRRADTERALAEAARVAGEQLTAANERLDLARERLTVIEKQIKEAVRMYESARLEFQDYLQHWEVYERARFEHAQLLYDAWLARLELAAARGLLPDACRGDS